MSGYWGSDTGPLESVTKVPREVWRTDAGQKVPVMMTIGSTSDGLTPAEFHTEAGVSGPHGQKRTLVFFRRSEHLVARDSVPLDRLTRSEEGSPWLLLRDLVSKYGFMCARPPTCRARRPVGWRGGPPSGKPLRAARAGREDGTEGFPSSATQERMGARLEHL